MFDLFRFVKDTIFLKFRHRKRGSSYVVLTTAEVQDASGLGLSEGDQVVVYVDNDGKWWIRKETEFTDGRFVLEDNHYAVEESV